MVSYFDFAINEECYSYNECHLLKPFIDNNKPVFLSSIGIIY
ncbi:MAG: endo alpha-1,4 polygalactosaminidase [Candidatus Gracilibacteria bacterium]|nr:endo alpha-1,4 polygalactosaminidase [Candidatus Gracilibacteria bacterium]